MKAKTDTNGTDERNPTPKPGDPSPDCGSILSPGGGSRGGAWCKSCGSLFGCEPSKPTPWGAREDAFLATVEAWIAEPRPWKEIEDLLADKSGLALFNMLCALPGYAPAAVGRATAILRAELKRRLCEAEGQAVERIGDKLQRRRAEPAAAGVAPQSEPKKRTHAPFSDREQRAFAELWLAKRRSLGRSPYGRDFLDEHREELKAIRVVTEPDVRRIRQSAAKRRLLPPLKPWKTGKRRKSER